MPSMPPLHGGYNHAAHGNLDIGTFVLESDGVQWAIDLGRDNYNLPGYFGSGRWAYYKMRAEGHNTLVINPGAGPDQEVEARAAIIDFQTSPDGGRALLDMTPAFAQANRVHRMLRMQHSRSQVLIEDEIDPERAV